MSSLAVSTIVRHYRWLGVTAPCLDTPVVAACGPLVIGQYGGHSGAGATKNEDGALVWAAGDGGPADWELALVLDAHATAESAALVLEAVEAERDTIAALLEGSVASAFGELERHFVNLFSSTDFRARCAQVQGETACLIAVRKARFLWWFSVGDCVIYLFHPDLARLGQYALNQRQFFEWLGQVHTFNLSAPCYSTGTRELRTGHNVILLTTDGLLECGAQPFADPAKLAALFAGKTDIAAGVHAALAQVHHEQGADSATLIAWCYDNREEAAQPSL
jgi:hypothetical protein